MIRRPKPKTHLDYKLTSGFEAAQRKLSDPSLADRLDKPLAYWVVATDRRLPMAFLDRPLNQLLKASLGQLLETPGIGVRKIQTLIMLLNRAAQPQPPGSLNPPTDAHDPTTDARQRQGDIDASLVSDALWTQWRKTIADRGFENEILGRL